jgi:hypothetical protein
VLCGMAFLRVRQRLFPDGASRRQFRISVTATVLVAGFKTGNAGVASNLVLSTADFSHNYPTMTGSNMSCLLVFHQRTTHNFNFVLGSISSLVYVQISSFALHRMPLQT